MVIANGKSQILKEWFAHGTQHAPLSAAKSQEGPGDTFEFGVAIAVYWRSWRPVVNGRRSSPGASAGAGPS